MRLHFPTARRAKNSEKPLWRLVGTAAFFIVLALAACAERPDVNRIPRDTLVVLTESRVSTLDPVKATDAESQKVVNLVHGALVRPDRALQLVPELARSFRVENGYRSFHFRLRPGLRFHDGSSLKAADFIRSFEEYRKQAPGGVAFARVVSAVAEDGLAVRIRTAVPQPFLLNDLYAVKIFRRHHGKVMGAGPFQIEAFSATETRLSRFKAFPEPPLAGSPRHLVFRFVADEFTRYQHLQRGDGNALLNALSPMKVKRLRSEGPDWMQVLDGPGITATYLCFNFRDPRLSKPGVRRAIAHAIDIDAILKSRFGSAATRATGLLSAAHADYYEPGVARHAFDRARAEKLLDEAGYPRQGPAGTRFSLVYKTTFDKFGFDLATVIGGMLKAVGIDVRLQPLEVGTFFDDIKAGNFQLFHSRWVGVTNPSIFFRVFHSSQAQGGLNRGAYSNRRLDDLVERGMVEPDDRARRRYFSAVQKLAAEDLPYLTLWHWNNTFIGTKRMKNVPLYPNGSYRTLSELELQ